MSSEASELTETSELNYDDYTHDFMGKVGNIADFSGISWWDRPACSKTS